MHRDLPRHPHDQEARARADRIQWRVGRLVCAGFDPALAEDLAHDERIDVHELLELVDRGCPPELAGRILADEVVFRGDHEAREFIAFWLRDGRVVAGMNVNVWDVNDHIRALIRSRRPINSAELTDPDVELETLAAAVTSEG
jgi:hypothetical protein